MKITSSIARKLGWYVYLYVNPLDGHIFYVGKGKGIRALAHIGLADRSERARILGEIRRAGKEPRIEILAHGLRDEQTAFRVEAAAIDLLDLRALTNRVHGRDSVEFGRRPLSELVALYSRRPIKIMEPALLIRVTQLYRPQMPPLELYDATRGVWVLGEQRHDVRFALAVFEGIVREVYEISAWLPAGSALYSRSHAEVDAPNRWEFVGRLAPERVRKKYIDRDVSAYLPRGAQNPLRYVNVKP